jgi:hypothetical protein
VQVVEELANDYAANGISSLARGQMEAFVVRSVALAKETNAAWFRASLPANYTQPNMQAVVCQNLLTVFDKLKDSLEQKFAQAIAALVAEQGNRCQSLLAIWQRNTLYPEYIHRLHANAGKRFTQHPIQVLGSPFFVSLNFDTQICFLTTNVLSLQILTLKSRIKPASAAIAVTVNGTHVTVSMESKIVSFRFSPQVYCAILFKNYNLHKNRRSRFCAVFLFRVPLFGFVTSSPTIFSRLSASFACWKRPNFFQCFN